MLTLDHRSAPELARAGVALCERFPDLPPPRLIYWTDRPVALVEADVPWLYVPARRDPTMVDGRHVIPRAQLRRLERFANLGVPFRAAAIAHELDPRGAVSALLPALADGPRTCTDDVARQLVDPVPTPPGLARVSRAASRVGHVRALVGDLLDPIVFGVAAPRPLVHGALALFFPLAVWRW